MNDDTFVTGKKATLGGLALVVLAWALAVAALPFAPASVPVHWGINGQPDRFEAPFPGLLTLPLVITLVALLMRVLPRLDPKRHNYGTFGGTYVAIQISILLFLFAMHIIILIAAFGTPIAINRVIMPMVGALFVMLGNIMGKVRPNWFVGFRTPWALASPDVWTRTHRFGGRLMVALGLAMIVGSLVLPSTAAFLVLLGGTLAMVIAVFAYSYRVWEQLEGSS